jgi:hypothetical protein
MSSLGNMSFPELTQIFPTLASIKCDGPNDVSLVNQTIVEELLQDICLLDFGHQARCSCPPRATKISPRAIGIQSSRVSGTLATSATS